MKKYGSLLLGREVILSGHPGLIAELYTFPLPTSGLYDVWAEEGESGVTRIHLSLGGDPGCRQGTRLRDGLSNQCHGGILICDSDKMATLPDEFDEDEDLWNFFAHGLCLKRSCEHATWKSNAPDGNIVFVPSQEYYAIAPLTDVPGYAILCRQQLEE